MMGSELPGPIERPAVSIWSSRLRNMMRHVSGGIVGRGYCAGRGFAASSSGATQAWLALDLFGRERPSRRLGRAAFRRVLFLLFIVYCSTHASVPTRGSPYQRPIPAAGLDH